jgi:hypothetical protein
VVEEGRWVRTETKRGKEELRRKLERQRRNGGRRGVSNTRSVMVLEVTVIVLKMLV